MSNSIFQPYLNHITETMANGRKRGDLSKANESINFSDFAGIGGSLAQKKSKNPWFDRDQDIRLFNSLQPLNVISGLTAKYDEKLGSHPHFTHIKEQNTTENHYIVSVFIDIKKSTELFKKYFPETVANITTTIQKAAIHSCWHFNGYIQRLQGDGLLVYFGGKNVDRKVAVDNALNAASVFSYFVKHDLKNLFTEQGIKNIYTRIGIDMGDDEDTFWHLAGVGECSETTTCSLHTNLASKLQSNATSNGIMVGDNVKAYSGTSSTYFTYRPFKSEDGDEKYVFEIPSEGFFYSQWEFDWYSHLKSLKSITEVDGQLHFADNSPESSNISKLLATAELINTGSAYTDRSGNLVSTETPVKNQEHRFHYDNLL